MTARSADAPPYSHLRKSGCILGPTEVPLVDEDTTLADKSIRREGHVTLRVALDNIPAGKHPAASPFRARDRLSMLCLRANRRTGVIDKAADARQKQTGDRARYATTEYASPSLFAVVAPFLNRICRLWTGCPSHWS